MCAAVGFIFGQCDFYPALQSDVSQNPPSPTTTTQQTYKEAKEVGEGEVKIK